MSGRTHSSAKLPGAGVLTAGGIRAVLLFMCPSLCSHTIKKVYENVAVAADVHVQQ